MTPPHILPLPRYDTLCSSLATLFPNHTINQRFHRRILRRTRLHPDALGRPPRLFPNAHGAHPVIGEILPKHPTEPLHRRTAGKYHPGNRAISHKRTQHLPSFLQKLRIINSQIPISNPRILLYLSQNLLPAPQRPCKQNPRPVCKRLGKQFSQGNTVIMFCRVSWARRCV